ncbi:MAG: hypothetical protein CMJ78_02485 [Planctomycetaceae bacterium]|nr:hypothetical protein [Planctomycetaceae bacterium]
MSEAFRRQGYEVEHTGGGGPDGGVDHRLRRAGRRVLVQCKHWKNERVGVKIARELLGVVTSESADEGVLITSGSFTPETIQFASKNEITLIDGAALSKMIRAAQAGRKSEVNQPAFPTTESEGPQTPQCPNCNSTMVLRTARKGANSGSQFWGCPSFPNCRGTRELDVAEIA